MEIYVNAGTEVEALLVMAAFRNYGEVRSRDGNRLWLVPRDEEHADRFIEWLNDTSYWYEVAYGRA